MKFGKLAIELESGTMTDEEFDRKLKLANESFVTNVIDFFHQGLPNITEKLRSYVASFTFTNENLDVKELDSLLVKINDNKLSDYYLNYRDTIVQIPEGFTGEFLEYVNTLNSIGPKIIDNTLKLIAQYKTIIASVISNVDQRTSHRDLTNFYNEANKACKELENHLTNYFSDNKISRARLITVLPVFNEAKPLNTATKQLSKLVSTKQLIEIQNSVKDVVGFLDIIETNIKNNDIKEISPMMVNNISKGASSLGNYIDQVVVFHYASISIISCVKLLFNKLSELK